MSIDAISSSWQHSLFKFLGVLSSIIASLAWLATIAALFDLWAKDDFIRYEHNDGDVVYVSNVGSRHKPTFIIGTVVTGTFFVLTLIFTKLCFDMENRRRYKRNISIVSIVFGMIASISLILLAIFDSINHKGAHYTFTGLFIIFTLLSAAFSIIYRFSHNQGNLAINLRVLFVAVVIPLVITFVVMGALKRPDNEIQLKSVAASLEWSISILFILYLALFALDLLLTGRLEKPSAPVLVNANHYSIELEWEHVQVQDQTRSRNRRIFDETGAAHSGSLIYLHQREKKIGSIWENIYTGSALGYKIENLKPNTQYEYRIQCKSGLTGERSEWSPILLAATTPEPMNGETVFKAIAVPGKEQLEKLLQILGPEHHLLEHPDKDGNLPLMHACAKLDINKVDLLIKAGANVNNYIGSGKTALMVAASTGFSKACALLIENGANIYSVDQSVHLGITILHHAIDSKNVDTIAVIIKQINNEPDEKVKDFEINRQVGPHKWTPLYRAVIHDCSKEIIELLLRNGANPECQDKSTSTTALQMAVIRGNLYNTQLLVNYGANTRTMSKVSGKTLQELASSTNKMDLINYVNSLPGAPRM
ncbi:unnamed protein product [Rotaria sp. Silwood2]|nr:unnamed protein product [Rotaria sp. Silwood2]CAF3090292.1 unnamed protein product [Rotaria sp. Silwood2]